MNGAVKGMSSYYSPFGRGLTVESNFEVSTATNTVNIRIIKMPPGEAPGEVRAAWVGLVLPVNGSGRGSFRTVGVLSRPKTWFGILIASLLGKTIREDGYKVEAGKAVEILSAHSAPAAQWWREHAALSIKPGKLFVFAAEVCEEVDL